MELLKEIETRLREAAKKEIMCEMLHEINNIIEIVDFLRQAGYSFIIPDFLSAKSCE